MGIAWFSRSLVRCASTVGEGTGNGLDNTLTADSSKNQFSSTKISDDLFKSFTKNLPSSPVHGQLQLQLHTYISDDPF